VHLRTNIDFNQKKHQYVGRGGESNLFLPPAAITGVLKTRDTRQGLDEVLAFYFPVFLGLSCGGWDIFCADAARTAIRRDLCNASHVCGNTPFAFSCNSFCNGVACTSCGNDPCRAARD
jgi:hypothetical protein